MTVINMLSGAADLFGISSKIPSIYFLFRGTKTRDRFCAYVLRNSWALRNRTSVTATT